MNRNTHRALTLPFAVAAALGTSLAGAAGGADIRAVCPGIDAALQQSLAPAWSRVGEPGIVRVQMNVQGQKVTRVTTAGGPSAYSNHIKRAVRDLSCGGGNSEQQSLSFEVSFVAPADHGDAPARSGS